MGKGWGEERGPTKRERAALERLHAADRMWTAIATWSQTPTVANEARVREAANDYDAARTAHGRA